MSRSIYFWPAMVNTLTLILVSVLWGSSFILMKWATLSFGPLSIGALRVVGGAAILGLMWKISRPVWNLSGTKLLQLIFLSLVGYVYPFALQPYLIRSYDSGFIGMSVSLVPILTIVTSIPMLKKFPSRLEWIAVLGGFAFTGILFRDGLDRNMEWKHLLILATVPLSYAIGNTFFKRNFQNQSPLIIACLAMFIAALFLLPFGAGLETIQWHSNTAWSFGAIAVLGVVSTGLAGYLFYRVVYSTSPLAAGMVGYTIPVVAMIWGWAAGEKITGMQVFALGGILSMVALAQRKS